MISEIIPSVDINALMPPHPGQIKLPQKMRRHRTASESSENENENENDFNSQQRRRENELTDSMTEDNENTEHESDNNSDDDMSGSHDDSMDDDDYYDSYEDSEEGEEELQERHLDIMNQLQSALFGVSNSTALSQSDLERLRQQITGGLFASAGPATHSHQIRSIIRSLPQQGPVDPMLLYSTFTELWEMIVLTGEEVEAYEFDSVVDLKPLLPHLLRVLRWEDDCQVYGGEFLLYAVRCTRACVQYSPGCARRLVESGLVPLITRQLFSVEYIDLAEDLIQIVQLLTKSGAHAKACLHADGIRAVLGFVDFFALSVQVNAFTAAAQMAPALTNETLHLYLPAETAALLRATVRRYTESDGQVLKLVHQATQILSNAIDAAPKSADELCPSEFVVETLLPLATVLPLDSATIVSRLVSLSPEIAKKLANSDGLFFKTLLRTAATNEPLLETALKLILDLFCQSVQKPLHELITLCLRNKTITKIEGLALNGSLVKQVSAVLLEFYLNSPSMTLSSRQGTLATLLLLDDCHEPAIDLVKMGLVSRLLSSASDDTLTLVIGLEWCRVLSSKQAHEFSSTALRQGLLFDCLTAQPLQTDEPLKKWLQMRLDSLNKTVFSGEEDEILSIYIKHMLTDLRTLLSGHEQVKKRACFNSVEELLNLLKSEKFTEYEWLGDPETCLARQLFNLLTTTDNSQIAPEAYEPICLEIYKALNRYDSHFALSLPLAKLTRATTSNPLEALAILARPLRVHLKHSITASEKLILCDPFANISWIVKMGTCTDQERKVIMRETTMREEGDHVEKIQDALTDSESFGVVDFSSTAFTSHRLRVYLQVSDRRVPLKPADSLIEVLFEHVLTGDKWKKINEIWAGGAVKLVVDEEGDDQNCETVDTHTDDDRRVKLALKLLKLLPWKMTNEHLSAKLSKEIDSPLLVAVNGISPHWLQSAQEYPFLYPFPLRLNLMKSSRLGRLRALWLLQQRTSHASLDLTSSVVSVPRRKFKIHRQSFAQCLANIFAPENCGDLRLFEFEYADELGSGHGPTMEFYALASINLCSDHLRTPEGLFPSWKHCDYESFRLMGAVVARAWLDDRIIDIPLHPIFINSLNYESCYLDFDHLASIDPDLHRALRSKDLIDSGVSFLVPGTEICLLPQDRLISTEADLEEFRGLLMQRINATLISARDSFLQGFNQSFPCVFKESTRFFTPVEVSRLFSQSTDTSAWSVQEIASALVTDHGYTPTSPQIRWLAELISETVLHDDKVKLIRFLTGAAHLPIGGWKALRPPLTIVCKSDTNDTENFSGANESITSTNISNIGAPTISSQSATSEAHDAYLPSVMTCANYLKLPRYSSKAVMKERLDYAIREGSDSFHLS